MFIITEEIEKNGFVLNPGRYVGFADEEDDGVPFNEKFKLLKSQLTDFEEEGLKLSNQIKRDLQKISYE